jgi:hypothetical protein
MSVEFEVTIPIVDKQAYEAYVDTISRHTNSETFNQTKSNLSNIANILNKDINFNSISFPIQENDNSDPITVSVYKHSHWSGLSYETTFNMEIIDSKKDTQTSYVIETSGFIREMKVNNKIISKYEDCNKSWVTDLGGVVLEDYKNATHYLNLAKKVNDEQIAALRSRQ